MTLPYIPFSNCAEVAFIGSQASQLTIITTAVHKTLPFEGSDLDDIATIAEDWVHDNLLPATGNAQRWDLVRVTDLTTISSPVLDHPIGSPNDGSNVGSAMPIQVAAVISKYTAKRGRSFRGRVYIPGLPLNDLVNGTQFSTSAAAALTALWQDLHTAWLLAGFEEVVLSRFNNGVRRIVGEFTPVTNIVAKTAVGTQRRRVIGHGS